MKLKKIKDRILPVLKKYEVTRAGIFGSNARNEGGKKSDIDILVEFGKPIGLLEFVHVKHELEDTLGKKVDLVEYSTIKPLLKESILKEQVTIL